ILDPEDLAITYLNTLPDTYSSLIQSMEPVLASLTSQSIKAKVREEEQRLKNVTNGNGGQAPNPNNVAANTAKSQQKKKAKTEQTSDSVSRINKKKDKCFHCGKLGHWENECRKRIAEEKGKENSGTRDSSLGQGGAAVYTAGMAYVANMAVAETVDGLCFTPVDQHNAVAVAHTATLKRGAKLSTWHERYGHAANSTIITLAASGNVEGLEILGDPKQDAKDMDVCVGCAMGKIHR